jgi:hypothetical protein
VLGKFIALPRAQSIDNIGVIINIFEVCVIPREGDYRPLSNVEKSPHNQVALGFQPEDLHPFAGKDLACHSDKRQIVHLHADI